MIPEWPELQTIEKKRLPGRRWLLAALAVPAVLIVLAGATWSTLRGLPDKLQRTLHDHGIQLEWGSFRFSSTGFILEEVESSRGIKGTAALTRVDVDFWSLLQGKPRVRSLSVEGFRARTSVQEFTALLSSLRKRRTDQAPSAGSAGESLPDQLRITRGHLTLTNKLNRPLVVLQEVVIRFSRQTGELSLDIDRLRLRERTIPGPLRLEFYPGKKGNRLPFLFSWARGSIRTQGKGHVDKAQGAISVFFKKRGLPANLPLIHGILPNPEKLLTATRLMVRPTPGMEAIDFKLHTGIANLRLQHKTLARTPVGPFPLRVKVQGRWVQGSDNLTIKSGSLILKQPAAKARGKENTPVAVEFKGELEHLRQFPDGGHARLSFTLKPTACQAVIDATPERLAPALKSFRLQGTASLQADISIGLHMPRNFSYKVHQRRFGCEVVRTPLEYSAERLNAPNPLQIQKGKNKASAPDRPWLAETFTPYRKLSPHFVTAIIASEDAGFRRHKGILPASIENALRRNLAEKKVVLGGSTITMQLAKNLFLSHERTIARKLQEVFLAWYLEEVVPKNKILSIYANIIEYGPDLYGIARAARHFFNKRPADLSLMESTWLASVLPSPKRRYHYFCTGVVTPRFGQVLQKRLERMVSLGRITTEDYHAAIGMPLKFNQQSRLTAPACHGKVFSRFQDKAKGKL